MREPPKISEERLRACLQEQYGILPESIEYLPRGADYNAGVYRVESDMAEYLLKAKSGVLYEPGCTVPRFLKDQGIASVVAPIPTKSSALWTALGGWNFILYPFLDGESTFTGMTDEQWSETGAIFSRIHRVPFLSGHFGPIRLETFDPTPYTRWVSTFQAEYLPRLRDAKGPACHVFGSWTAHQSTIDRMAASLEKLGSMLRARVLPQVICHADMHPANLLRDRAGRVHVIDWDDVMLAPKERDFIFVWEPDAHAFWHGYGGKDIDWVALSYYNWERVITDLIEYAKDACLRNDLSEETRAELAQDFDTNLSGRNLEAARAAEAHLAE